MAHLCRKKPEERPQGAPMVVEALDHIIEQVSLGELS